MRAFPCPLCAEHRELRTDKNQKPYLICDECGVQLFIRKDAGNRRLETMLQLSGPGVRRQTNEKLFEAEVPHGI